ncbi:MAG: outer membrane protein assembly factor [Proteobacteria bacterium]|nr:outer membrane protein assembly factor [Pseudomonadota bacterium]
MDICTSKHRPSLRSRLYQFRTRVMMDSFLAILAIVFGTPRAHGDPPSPPSPAASSEPGAAAPAELPEPEAASGIAIAQPLPGRTRRAILRYLLFIPRWAFTILMAPPRGAMWVYERYSLQTRFEDIFMNTEKTLGVFPLASYESGFGVGGGALFFYRDLFGKRGQLRLSGTYGGLERQRYVASISTGDLLGERVEVRFEASYRLLLNQLFFGYGTRDMVESTGGAPIDPRDAAVRTRYRHEDMKGAVKVSVEFSDVARARLATALTRVDFRRARDTDGPDAADVYDIDALVGYRSGLRSLYNELELVFDTRRPTATLVPPAAPATGWRGEAFIGYQLGVVDDPSNFFRYGFDVRRHIDLYAGDRVLVLRAFVDSVIGDTGDIPFHSLPRLGGPRALRGYQRNRFRDRTAGFVSAEYRYPISRNALGFLYIDAGSVWPGIDAIDTDAIGLGYGGGFQLHGRHTFLARIQVLASADGDLLFNLSFDPVSDPDARYSRP